MNNRLYLFTYDEWDWDECVAGVISAPTEVKAVEIALAELPNGTHRTYEIECIAEHTNVKEGVVLDSFNAG